MLYAGVLGVGGVWYLVAGVFCGCFLFYVGLFLVVVVRLYYRWHFHAIFVILPFTFLPKKKITFDMEIQEM